MNPVVPHSVHDVHVNYSHINKDGSQHSHINKGSTDTFQSSSLNYPTCLQVYYHTVTIENRDANEPTWDEYEPGRDENEPIWDVNEPERDENEPIWDDNEPEFYDSIHTIYTHTPTTPHFINDNTGDPALHEGPTGTPLRLTEGNAISQIPPTIEEDTGIPNLASIDDSSVDDTSATAEHIPPEDTHTTCSDQVEQNSDNQSQVTNCNKADQTPQDMEDDLTMYSDHTITIPKHSARMQIDTIKPCAPSELPNSQTSCHLNDNQTPSVDAISFSKGKSSLIQTSMQL